MKFSFDIGAALCVECDQPIGSDGVERFETFLEPIPAMTLPDGTEIPEVLGVRVMVCARCA